MIQPRMLWRAQPIVRQAMRWYRINHEAVARLEQQAREIDARPPPIPKQRGSDRNLLLTAIGLFATAPLITYFWYEHRKEHMGKKKQDLIKHLEERRERWLSEKE
ncbi:hypothetical protein AC578_10052 [Pseudocercospora eumusae]|uniref:Uncharacterized protein n=1 Tax=Pseudocercospora eumusae TaxID=321146 RepID=A0A139H849_9PEZI|nr:hypothetical protein AC578_10052 [Pseudocercospora eumusae]